MCFTLYTSYCIYTKKSLSNLARIVVQDYDILHPLRRVPVN